MYIVVGSANQLKIDAVKDAFPEAEVVGLQIQSSVSEEPIGREETLIGARHRAQEARKQFPGAKMWLGIESGFTSELPNIHQGEIWTVFVSVVIIHKQDDGVAVEHEIWSKDLICPITALERKHSISEALDNWKIQNQLDKNFH